MGTLLGTLLGTGVLTGQLALAFFSISLAFLSSSQVWELTILNKINDLISLIHYEIPPEDFCPDVSDEKKRKVMFSEQCREEVKVGRKYLRWIDTNFDLFSPNVKALKAKRSKNKDKLA